VGTLGEPTGNWRAVVQFRNLKGVDINALLKKPLSEIKTQLTKKQWDTLKKHLNRAGDDFSHGN